MTPEQEEYYIKQLRKDAERLRTVYRLGGIPVHLDSLADQLEADSMGLTTEEFFEYSYNKMIGKINEQNS